MQETIRSAWERIGYFFCLVVEAWAALLEALYTATLPVTSRLFSRRPLPPTITVNDRRCNRIRFHISSSFSSPFNREKFEIRWKESSASGDWQITGPSDLQLRTVARLKPNTAYDFEFRASNHLGCCSFSSPITARTRQDPVDGGGQGPGYTWSQTRTDVVISIEVQLAATKRDVQVELKKGGQHLSVTVLGEVLLDGTLFGRARGWDDGSFWELSQTGQSKLLVVTLEKAKPSVSPKFDFWRAIREDTPDLEIDTHAGALQAQFPTELGQPMF